MFFMCCVVSQMLVAVSMIIGNWNGDLLCSNDKIVFNTFSPLSKFAASVLTFGHASASCWTLCIAIKLYLNVVSGWKKRDIEKTLKPMWVFSISLPLIIVAIGNYRGFGYSETFQYGFPFFTLQGDRWYITGLFIIPVFIMSTLGTLIMGYVIYRVSSILLGKEDMNLTQEKKDNDKTIKKRWKKMLKFNQRSLLFVLLVGIGGMVAMIQTFDLLIIKFESIKDDFEDYIACLLTVSKPLSVTREDMAEYPTEVCGEAMNAFHYWDRLYFSVLFQGSFGLLPLVVYGVKGHIKNRLMSAMNTVRQSIGSQGSQVVGADSKIKSSDLTPNISRQKSGQDSSKHSDSKQDSSRLDSQDDTESKTAMSESKTKPEADKKSSQQSANNKSEDDSNDMNMIPLVGMLVDIYRYTRSLIYGTSRKDEEKQGGVTHSIRDILEANEEEEEEKEEEEKNSRALELASIKS